MADMFSKSPSEKGQKALKVYNKCWNNVSNACFETDNACKLQAFEEYRKN